MVLEEKSFLFLINIEGHAAKPTALERLDERGGVHKFAVARVDEERAGLQAREDFRVQQVAVLRCELQVQRDDVARGEQRVKLRVADAVLPRSVRRGHGVEGEHRRVEADQAGEREVVFGDAVPGSVNPAVQRQQQADGVLGDGVR